MADIDLNNKRWLDIVFDGRNKAYGAYQLRQKFNRTMIISIIIGLLGVGLLMATPIIISKIKEGMPHQKVDVDLETPMSNVEIDQPEPPPEVPDVPPPPPKVKEVKFTEPEVVEQEKVKEEDIPPPAETVEKDVILGDETVDGLSKFDVPIEAPEDGTGDEIVGEVIDNKVYSMASIQKKPKFPGNVYEYIGDELEYPEDARSAGVSGRVYVKFTIEKDGSVTNVQVIRGQQLGHGLPEEAIRVVKGMPRWTPGEVNGNKVRVSYIIPIVFQVNY